MTIFKLTLAALATSAATVALAGPVVDSATPTYLAKIDPSVSFPDPSSSWSREGRFVSPKAIRMVAPGLSRPEVYSLIGVPMFNELFPGKKSWNYIFNFYTGVGDAFVQCQYQIRWHHGPMRVEDAYWQDAACAKFVADVPPPPPPPPPPSPPPVVQAPEAKTYIVYFPFDRSELTPEAAAVIRAAADYAHAGKGAHSAIVGYTDTSGSAAYDEALSERRARAVADALGSDGVETTTLDVSWKGKTELAKPTADGVKEPLNRRATIVVTPAQ